MADQTGVSRHATVKWLGDVPQLNLGTTFGVPWRRGTCHEKSTAFIGTDKEGSFVPLQSWATSYWPDGSIKWTAHAIPPSPVASMSYQVQASRIKIDSSGSFTPRLETKIAVQTSDDEILVNTGQISVLFGRSGSNIVQSISTVRGETVGKNGHLVLLSQKAESSGAEDEAQPGPIDNFKSKIDNTTLTRDGPVRALVTVRGKHQHFSFGGQSTDTSDDWIPFILRFYLYAGSAAIRIVHTIIYDGDPQSVCIRGIGLRFEVPLNSTELYDRHIRIAGVDGGVLAEAVQGITGLRRDPGGDIKKAQLDGRPTPPLAKWHADFTPYLKWVPSWSDFKLSQLSSDGFTLEKRTKPGNSWIKIPGGTKAGGLAYLGSASKGGIAVGMREFWERYPTSLDIRGAAGDTGQITLWLYSPSAEPMDLRPYHDGLGQDTFDDQLDGLKITYEDWEDGLGSPYGIARTNEIYIFGLEKTPSAAEFAQFTEYMRTPPVLTASSEYIYGTGALGNYWEPISHNSQLSLARKAEADTIEKNLEFLFAFYQDQIVQRRWYGFWDYGDVMHTYDGDRHAWRYDVGGYAWDNSELSPDLWLWLYFLRTGRPDVYRIAEALTRHTGEVDAYHLGSLRGLGTRHGVQHWSDSCKQLRVSNALYRRVFYFVSGGDERTGELLEETLDGEETLVTLDPYRKVRKDREKYVPNRHAVNIMLGTDWSALAASWFIEWERRGSRWKEAKSKLVAGMTGIGHLHNGFVTCAASYDIDTGSIAPPAQDPKNKGVVRIAHLSAMFGLLEICAELIESFGENLPTGFKEAWLDYCQYFNASNEEQQSRYGVGFGELILRQGHSRLTGYAAVHLSDDNLMERSWKEFYTGDGYSPAEPWKTQPIEGSMALTAVDEAPWISTNITSLYGLAAIQNLAFSCQRAWKSADILP